MAQLDRVEGVAERLFGRGEVELIDEAESASTYFYTRPTIGLRLLGDRWWH